MMNGDSRAPCPNPRKLTLLPLSMYTIYVFRNFSPPSRNPTHDSHKIDGKAGTALVEQLNSATSPTLGYAPRIYNECRRPAFAKKFWKRASWNMGTSNT